MVVATLIQYSQVNTPQITAPLMALLLSVPAGREESGVEWWATEVACQACKWLLFESIFKYCQETLVKGWGCYSLQQKMFF